MMFPSCKSSDDCEHLLNNDLSEWGPDAERPDHIPTLIPRQESLRDFVSALKKRARFAAVLGKTRHLEMIASELFLGPITISIDDDPELDDKRYVVVHVEAKGSAEEMVARRRKWYKLTQQLLGAECELVQLSITIS